MELKRLFEPVNIGKMVVKNRLVMPGLTTGYCDASGYVTSRLEEHYAERARGGVGLIIVEAAPIALGGRAVVRQLGVHDDSYLPGLRRLAAAIKGHGSKCALQIAHAGRRASSKFNDGIQPVAPSSIACWGGEVPRELTINDIGQIMSAFAESAKRAKDAGFDAVELHFAHGYLVAQFLSPLTNKRQDKYGGDLESRARFAIEVVRHVREKVGEDYPLIARIGGDEYIKGGLNLRDAQNIARILERAGLDALNVSAGYTASSEEGYLAQLVAWSAAPISFPRGCFVHLAEGIKKSVSIPVMALGRINTPQLAEQILTEGKADLVAMGRALLADPEFAIKAFQGRYDDIRTCVGCNTCQKTLSGEVNLRCMVNVEQGKAGTYRIKRTGKTQRVLVVGGGPAGMEAARVAALRGHEVLVYEKDSRLGGNLIPASAVSFKKELEGVSLYLSTQIRKLGVKVQTGIKVDKDVVSSIKPDAVIVATGARPILPDIPGISKQSVTDAVKVLSGNIQIGPKVVVVGGGMVGCEVAVFLAESGREVTLVTRRSSDFSLSSGLAIDMDSRLRKWLLFELWPKLPIQVVAHSTFEEVVDEGLIVRGREGDRRLIEGDTIAFALGLSSDRELAKALRGAGPVLYEIGDCVQPRQIIDAIHEGASVGRQV